MAARQIYDKQRRLVTYKWLLNKVGASYKTSDYVKSQHKTLTLADIKKYFNTTDSKESTSPGIYIDYTVKSGKTAYLNRQNVIERDLWLNEGGDEPTPGPDEGEYSVTINVNGKKDKDASGNTTNQEYSTTKVTLPTGSTVDSITVTVGGVGTSDYTWNGSTSFSISNVTGNVVVNITTSGGTKVTPFFEDSALNNIEYLIPIGARIRLIMRNFESDGSLNYGADTLINFNNPDYPATVTPDSGADAYGSLRITQLNINSTSGRTSEEGEGTTGPTFDKFLVFDAYKVTAKGANTLCSWTVTGKNFNGDIVSYKIKIPIGGVAKTALTGSTSSGYTSSAIYTNIKDLTTTGSGGWYPMNAVRKKWTTIAPTRIDESDNTTYYAYYQGAGSTYYYVNYNKFRVSPYLNGFENAWYKAKHPEAFPDANTWYDSPGFAWFQPES